MADIKKTKCGCITLTKNNKRYKNAKFLKQKNIADIKLKMQNC